MAVRDLGIVTAYGYAVEGGYTGTEQEFTALLGDLALTVEDLENMTVSVTTLEPNQQATASYADGVLSLGIPKGVAGEVQFSDLEPLAEKDGNYENFTAGSALQLISDKYTEDKELYLSRKSIAGDRELDTLVGGSIAWNQLAGNSMRPSHTKEGVTYTPNSDGSFTLNGTAEATDWWMVTPYDISSIIGHKYILWDANRSGVQGQYGLCYGNIGIAVYGDKAIIINSRATTEKVGYAHTSGAVIDNVTFKPVLIDLTQMFGSSVADYIYALEQATTGAGVAFFRAMFPKDYYAYNAGELMSVKTTAHEMVGFNQWDEEWELGSINWSTGENVSASNNIRSKNYIPAFPNTTYYFKTSTGIDLHYYDAEYSHISAKSISASGGVFTTPANASYVRFLTTGTTYNGNICISISSDRNGEYQPYTKYTYPLGDVELRGIPKLDANGDIYFDGDTYESDGTVTRRYGFIDLGTITYWQSNEASQSGYMRLIANISEKKEGYGNVISNRFSAKVNGVGQDVDGYESVSSYGTNKAVYIVIQSSKLTGDMTTAYGRSEAFKQWLASNPTIVIYELATPTIETADPYTNPQIVDAYGTERYVDERTVAVPVGHVTKYPDNLREKLDGLPWDFSSLIAPTEKAYTATRNYTAGSLLIVNNILYKVTANIANGGAITPNTNVVATTLSEVISAL